MADGRDNAVMNSKTFVFFYFANKFSLSLFWIRQRAFVSLNHFGGGLAQW